MDYKKGDLKENDVVVINNKEYKFITVKGRSKLVAKDGELLNPYRNQKVGLYKDKCGYLTSGGGAHVHKYVAKAWVDGYFEGAEVNHKDFNRMNNNSDNLEWVTHFDNIQYSVEGNYERICASKRGENNGRSNFTEEQVKEMRRLYEEEHYSIADLVKRDYPNLQTSKEYKSLWSTYSNIVKRITWKHI